MFETELSEDMEKSMRLENGSLNSSARPIPMGHSPGRFMDRGRASPRLPVDDFTIPRTLVHSASLDFQRGIHLDVTNESKVLVLYTGGTIGMVRNGDGVLAPRANVMEHNLKKNVTMHDEAYSRLRFGSHGISAKESLPLVLPPVPEHKRVIYTICEYDPLLDSSNMTMDDWIQIAKDIKASYHMFDGFIILHGTDTLAYTASALSFMLENLGKTVIVTGSQIPCYETRSDGRDNFVGSLIIAGNYTIPEVSVYFDRKLMRGNRTIKVSAGSLHAFESPNLPPLATVGIDIHIDYRTVWKPSSIAALNVQANLCRDVVLLRLFPSIRTETILHFLQPPIKGVVLQCYGAGNMPSNRQDIIDALSAATRSGVIIVSCTQCSHGSVTASYETGKALIDAGVIPNGDITPEAAVAKLSYILAKNDLNHEQRREIMEISIRGEMTIQFSSVNPMTLEVERNKASKLDLIEQVARAMNLSSGEEMNSLKNVLFPSLLCSIVFLGDLEKLKTLEDYDADYSAPDYSGRTALHVAATVGGEDVLKWLLEHGANVHARDKNNETPLMAAAKAENEETVRLLVQCGGGLGLTPSELGELMVSIAGQGKCRMLEMLLIAGAHPDISCSTNDNTPLHAAIEGDQPEVAQLLLSAGASLNIPNKYGLTPLDIAKTLKRKHMLELYQNHQAARKPLL